MSSTVERTMPVCGETTASSRGSATPSGVGWTRASSGTRRDLLEPGQRRGKLVHLGAGRAARDAEDAVSRKRQRHARVERVERARQGRVETGEVAQERERGDGGDEGFERGRGSRRRRGVLERPQLVTAVAGGRPAQPVTGEAGRLAGNDERADRCQPA